MSGLIGRRLGRYEVVSLLGAGGMGEVYRARDTELERDVALKVLPEAAAEDPDRLERFARESRAVARLSHPNILEIHDVGCDDGVHYAVAELLEGESLRERLKRGRLPVRKAVAIADAISRGLGAAHSQGVVHRDVKPENVLLTSDGRVKVLDFGIASLHEPEVQAAGPDASEISTITAAGSLLGTIGYMAPEQVRGEAADARSDVFALGCVLYEMLTGQRAFHRTTPAETLAAILHDEPPLPVSLVPEIPAGIDRVVMRCLEKEPGERFQSAADVAFALRASDHALFTSSKELQAAPRARRWWGATLAALAVALTVAGLLAVLLGRGPPPLPEPLPDEVRLAVARFTSTGDSADGQLTAIGIGECLAADLVLLEEQQKGSMWVLPDESPATVPTAELSDVIKGNGITLVLDGSVSTPAGRLQLDLSLVEPKSHQVVRRAVVREDPTNVAACRRQAVTDVAAMLGIVLDGDTLEKLRRSGTTVGAARAAFLLGLGALASDPPQLDVAVRELERATAADPGFAAAWSALARAQSTLAKGSPSPDFDAALASARRAVAVGWDPRGAQLTLASILTDAGRPAEAVEALEAAVRERPRSAEAYLRLGKALLKAQRFDDAETTLQRSVYLRPNYWIAYHWLGSLDKAQDRKEEAAVHWRRALELVPENPKPHTNLGAVYDELDRPDDARRMYEHSLELKAKGNVKAQSNLGKIYYDMGRFADAARLYTLAVDEDPKASHYWGYLGFSWLWAGNRSEADTAFRRAIELGAPEVAADPGDAEEIARIAQYQAFLGERATAVSLLERAELLDPTNAIACAVLAEGWESASDRERALKWVAEALAKGVSPRRFNTDPAMRELVADPRYRGLIQRPTAGPEN